MYQQLVQPDLTIVAQAGWCLWFTQEVFHVPHLYPNASTAWANTKQRTDALPNASAPVWFSWGVDGHVATRTSDGRVFSSPITGHGNIWFSSVEDCAKAITQATGIKCSYLGWSEDLSGVQLIKGGVMSVVNDGDTINYFLAAYDRMPDQPELDKNRNKEWNNPDPSLRAPLYDDVIGRARYLTEENKRLQKLLDEGHQGYREAGTIDNETIYKKESK